MSIYHVWARFNLYSFEDELTIFDRWQVPFIEYDAIVTEYEKEFFKCDLHDGYSETSYLVILKISKNKLEELRLIQPLEWEYDEKINKKEKLNIEDGFFNEGYTKLKITNSMKFNSGTGKLSFRSLYQGSMYSDDVRENCINSLKKNDLDINGILAGLRKSPRFIDKEDGGFSFTWKKGGYEAFNISAENPKTKESLIYGSVIRPQSDKNDKIDFIINE